jgi:nitrate reductase cytochrome c-type subunit
MKIILFLALLLVSIDAKYMDSKSCAECHDVIHSEHASSMHASSSIFKDEFHRKIKEINFPNTYNCAICHTPGATDLEKIRLGKVQPSKTKQQLDGVSCLYCHQIARIEKSHKQNKNITTFGREGTQLLYGTMQNPGQSDKHDSITINKKYNIFSNSQVCMGCHSHKLNDADVEICQISIDQTKQTDCIKCHMPKYQGGATKLNKKGREEYSSHDFLGVRDTDMVKKAVELKLEKIAKDKIKLTIKNKMGHQILLQPMRLKYVKTTITRDDKIIWQNFKESPYEDKEATFSKLFKNDKNEQVYPPKATGIKYYTNLDTYKSKDIIYNVPALKKGDIITSTWISYDVRPSLVEKLKLSSTNYGKKIVGTSVDLDIK